MKPKYRRGVFFAVYIKSKTGKPQYLILKRKLHWTGWEFPKGGIEKKEEHLHTVKRELKEEIGLDVEKIKKFKVKGSFEYDGQFRDRMGIAGQTFESLYAVEVKKKKIKLNDIEHSDYIWLPFDQALKKLTWRNQKDSLKVVDNWIKKMKFREFITKRKISIWIGRDMKQNEELVGMFKGKENIIMHTAAAGSPFCVIDDKKPSHGDKKETAVVCARYSQDWKNNKKDIKVHVFTGKDIYKRKGMKIGTFGVKNFKIIKIKKREIQGFEKR